MSNKRETGIFSGSFNPVHMGHLMLANYISAFTSVEEIWFVVSPQSPLKKADDLLDDDIRLEMVRLALQDYDQLIPSDVEFHMPRPSYTIDTLDALTQAYPDRRFSLIIGSDNWSVFDRWKEYERLIRDYRILIYPRLGVNAVIPEQYHETIQPVNAPLIEISSTFIRHSIRDGKNIRAFLPPAVFDYIKQNRLYR